jgi:heat shock protein HslJ
MTWRTIPLLLALAAGGLFSPAQASASELAGTAWRLLNIASMDDTDYRPDDPSKYTLQFAGDGAVSIQADCNRGTGSWDSEASGQLRFGPIASTRALCPPGSLSERYLAQFEWVRSYVMRDGHLYLATMADGSIIEFEPLAGGAPLAATVLGEEIRTTDAAEMQDAILTRLFDRYAADNDLTAKPAEIDAFVETTKRGMAESGLTAADELTPEEAAELDRMRRAMGASLIRQWKINRSLYEAYGGRIIYQQLGPEPLDAYREYLEERRDAGDFSINEPAMAASFWRYFTDESIHDFMEPGGEDAARAFKTPPWEGNR